MAPYELEMIEAPPLLDPWTDDEGPVDVGRLEQLDDAALDELPFGVIALRRDGTILRYNLAEARLARLDRAVVKGKGFFDQIAPCTARPEFQGRFEAFLDDPFGPKTDRFSYLFDFSFGAQLVAVELARASDPAIAYLLINRAQVLPVREDAFRPAPSLRAWEGEAPRGVLRDDRSQRFVRLPASALGKLLRAAQRLGIDEGQLLEEWGVEQGRRAAIDLEASALEGHGEPLRRMRIGEALGLLEETFIREGWGTLRVDFAPSPQSGAFVVRVGRSVWQDSLRAPAAVQHRFTQGYLSAVLAHLAGRRILVRAVVPAPGVATEANEDAWVELLVVAESRQAALEEAFREAPGGTVDILQYLGKILP